MKGLNASRGDAAFAARLAAITQTRPEAPRPAPTFPALPEGAIALGVTEFGAPIGIDLAKLLEHRLLVQGVSGAGKSWTLRRVLEQTAPLIQQIVIDPEGEFKSLAEELGHMWIDGAKLNANAFAALGLRLRESRVSAVIDISDLDRTSQMKSITFLLNAMIDCDPTLWHAALVAIDEVHLLAPWGSQDDVAPAIRKASVSAVVHLMNRGRKRGLAGVIATQRLANLSKSAASPIRNVLIGNNTLDLDIRRAAETIGWDARKAFDRLPMLEPGSFVAAGPAFTVSPAIARIGTVRSRHIGATPVIVAPVASTDTAAVGIIDLDGLMRESEAPSLDEARLASGTRQVRMFVRDPGFAAASAVYTALKRLVPNGALIDELDRHLGFEKGDVAAAIALLESHGIVQIETINNRRAVRIDHEFASWRV